jgi:hypothetical protein
MAEWRNLSKPQRAALRLLLDRQTAAIGKDLQERTFKSLRDMGLAALASGSRSESRRHYFFYGEEVSITEAGRELVNGR